MDFNPCLGCNITTHTSVDNKGIDINLGIDLARLSNNQGVPSKDLAVKLTVKTKHALKGHLPFKSRPSAQKGIHLVTLRHSLLISPTYHG